MKRALVFLAAVVFFAAAAWYRPGDSAHAMVNNAHNCAQVNTTGARQLEAVRDASFHHTFVGTRSIRALASQPHPGSQAVDHQEKNTSQNQGLDHLAQHHPAAGCLRFWLFGLNFKRFKRVGGLVRIIVQ